MKAKNQFLRNTIYCYLSISSLAVSCFTHQLQAEIYYWDSNGATAGFGNTTGTWGTSAFLNTNVNGTGSTFTTTTTTADELRFGFNGDYANANVAINAGGVSINAISFRGGQVTGVTLGNTSNTITLGGTTPTISNLNISTVHNIAAVLAGSGVALTKSEVGLIALSGANTYDGGTSISGGTLVFRNLASKASSGTHAFGADTVLGLGVGGAGFFSTTDFENAREGTMTGNLSNITLNATTAVGLDTTAGNLTYASAITGARGFAKLGNNTLTIGTSNTYTGATTIQGGTLNVPTLANAGTDSSIGNFASPGAAGLLLRGGVFNFTGTGTVTTDRGFTATGQSNTIQVGANTNLSLGDSNVTTTGATQTLAFSHGTGSSINVSRVTIPNHNLNFTMTAANAVSINHVQVNSSANAFDIAVRTGTNPVTIGNIVQTTPINNGVHWLSNINLTGSISGISTGASSSLVLGGASVTLSGMNSFDAIIQIQQTGIYTINSIKNVGTSNSSSLGAPSTVAKGTIQFGNGSNTPTLRYTGAGDTTDRVLNLRSTTGTVTLEQAGTGLLKFTSNTTATGAGSKIFRLSGSTAGIGEMAGTVVNNSTSNTTSLEKTGVGTWILSGANTYSGDTSVTQGTLLINNTSGSGSGTGNLSVSSGATLGGTGTLNSNVTVAANGRLSFRLTSPSGTHDSLEIASGKTLTFSGDSVLDLSSSSAASLGTYTLVFGGQDIVGTAPTSVILPAGWTANPPVISGNELQVTITSTGASSAYSSWVAANAPGSNVNDDTDGDGVTNGVEFILGGTTASNDISKLPTLTTNSTNMSFTFQRAQSSIDPKTSLSVETSTDLVSWAASYPVSDSAIANASGITVVKNTSPSFDTVTLSIPRSPDDKKFARLRVVIAP